MSADETINKNFLLWICLKILVIAACLLSCVLLFTVFKSWSMTTKLLACSGLLIVLWVSFVISMLERAASSNSTGDYNSKGAKLQSLATFGFVLTSLFVIGTALLSVYQALI